MARAAPSPEPVPHVLPRGRHAAPPEVVAASQRGRLLAAVADAVAEKGYANAAVADVIARAGISRKTFYEHFANKEECFLAAYDAGVDRMLGEIDAAIDAAPDWLAAATAGTRRYLELLEGAPAFARTFLIEVLAAGPEALARRAAVHRRFADQLRTISAAAHRDVAGLPPTPEHAPAACVGAVAELVTAHVVAHGADGLTELLEPIVDVQLALLAGREHAGRLGATPARRRRRRARG